MKSNMKPTENFTVRVGGASSDIPGYDSNAIQMAADLARSRGSGIVLLSAGEYEMIGPVRLYDGTSLRGQGNSTVLKKTTGFSVPLAIDVDYGTYSVCVADSRAFRPGTGIQISDGLRKDGWDVSTSKVVAVEGQNIVFDRRTIQNYEAGNEGIVSNACTIIEIMKAHNVTVSDLLIDGNKTENLRMDNCRGGAIFIHKSSGCCVDNVTIRNFYGDGISWQITDDISVHNTEIHNCTGFGLHPGSGSARSVVESCHSHDNGSNGLFLCWSVQYGKFSNNVFCDNSGGISIGHKDSDNLFENNRICRNKYNGVYIRKEIESNKPHRNIFKGNIIEDNGNGDNGAGFFFETPVDGNVIEDNRIGDTGSGRQKTGIVCRGGNGWLDMKGNVMYGHVKDYMII